MKNTQEICGWSDGYDTTMKDILEELADDHNKSLENLTHSGMWYNPNSPIDGFVGFRIAGQIYSLRMDS